MSAAAYTAVERIAGDRDALREFLRLHARGLEYYELTAALENDDTLTHQLAAVGVGRVEAASNMDPLHALLLPALSGDKKIILLCRQRTAQWSLLFAHELGHAACPSTCGWCSDPEETYRVEGVVECFARLWLSQSRNATRVVRFLAPLRDGRKRVLKVGT